MYDRRITDPPSGKTSGSVKHTLDPRRFAPRYNRRWPPEAQTQLLLAIDCGVLTEANAIERYSLRSAQIVEWRLELAAAQVEVSATVLEITKPHDGGRLDHIIYVLVQKGRLTADEASYICAANSSPFGIERVTDDIPLFDCGVSGSIAFG